MPQPSQTASLKRLLTAPTRLFARSEALPSTASMISQGRLWSQSGLEVFVARAKKITTTQATGPSVKARPHRGDAHQRRLQRDAAPKSACRSPQSKMSSPRKGFPATSSASSLVVRSSHSLSEGDVKPHRSKARGSAATHGVEHHAT